MHSFNPFLRAFFKSPLPQQCNPVNNHVLLVPTTECLLTARDRESNTTYVDLATSEEFLASHVLRIPSAPVPGGGSVRDSRGKAKQFNTINGRTVVIKESFVYSNKGFRNLNQAQLLSDQLYYSDSLDAQQWLIYYISRPLVGSYEPIKVTPATLPGILKSVATPEGAGSVAGQNEDPDQMNKKEVKSFNDLLNGFPIIARQMQPGLDKVFSDFNKDMNDWDPSRQTRTSSTKSRRSSTSSQHSMSNGSVHSKRSNGHSKAPDIVDLPVGKEEEYMRKTLETAVTAAIELFQQVDKQQLSFLGATTELTGPLVERFIERYVAEQLHDAFLFPRICNSRKLEDLELETRIYGMQHIDIAQVGIVIDDGRKAKEQLVNSIGKGVEEFRKLSVASSPQQMIEVLLATQKLVMSSRSPANGDATPEGQKSGAEKAVSNTTMNADTLVSLLLVVVIRSQVRHLQARLSYMRNFIFIDDVEGGEIGYALSTFEAVLTYLISDSGGLRTASRRNKRLWQAVKTGALREIQTILEPGHSSSATEAERRGSVEIENEQAIVDGDARDDKDDHHMNGFIDARSAPSSLHSGSQTPVEDGYISEGSTLAHVSPFQATVPTPKVKRVSMDARSFSNASEYSFVSRTTTLDSFASTGIEGDTSIETLAQTQDAEGDSILMMAVEAGQVDVLDYLLSLEDFFAASFVLEDNNKESNTLFSAAVQLAHPQMIESILRCVFQTQDHEKIAQYFARPDSRGRTVAHYLFNAPRLIPRIWDFLPWRLKDKIGQTPLLALCRSYDHPDYSDMVNNSLEYATREQDDDQLLHLDNHIDAKGNTLLHVVNDPSIAVRILRHCDSDANATNDKRFTPLMVASKYGRMDMVRALFGDNRVDILARENRGMTAVELAKDDEIRNRIDDMVLVSNAPAADGRVTAVVRSFFVEDASIRMIIKSAVRNENGMIGVTTCRRSLTDFENLAKWLAVEHPASWLPSIFNFRSPFQIPSRPSRAVLQDIQIRLDKFLKMMLAHSTFSTHELLWEFILFPEIQPDMMAERSSKKAEIRMENIKEDYEPIEDVRDVSLFVEHARDSIRGVNHSTKSVIRRVNSLRVGLSNHATATTLLAKTLSTLPFLPQTHLTAINRFATATQPPASEPHHLLHQDLSALHASILAILSSLARPDALISSLQTIQKSLSRNDSSLRRSDRWLGALLEETRKSIQGGDSVDKVARGKEEFRAAGSELRYCQQTVAGELAGWWDLHAKLGRRAIRGFAEKMVVRERERLEGMRRAVRGVEEGRGR